MVPSLSTTLQTKTSLTSSTSSAPTWTPPTYGGSDDSDEDDGEDDGGYTWPFSYGSGKPWWSAEPRSAENSQEQAKHKRWFVNW